MTESEIMEIEPIDVDFSARGLAKITCPPSGRPDRSGRLWIADPEITGLSLMVTESGVRVFYWRRRIHGKSETVRIAPLRVPGGLDGLSVEQARKRAAELNSERAAGRNPRDAVNRAKAEATLGEAFTTFLEWSKVHKKSWGNDEYNYNRFLAPWKSRRLSSILRKDVETLHSRIGGDNGKYAANRVLSLLSSIINNAEVESNPCRGVKKFPEQTRARFLAGDELPRFFKALDALPNEMIRDFFGCVC